MSFGKVKSGKSPEKLWIRSGNVSSKLHRNPESITTSYYINCQSMESVELLKIFSKAVFPIGIKLQHWKEQTCSAARRSILGTQLWVLYVNDLP